MTKEFTRRVNSNIEDNLTKSYLWLNHLKQDCIDGKVFLAVRNDRIDFYHKGGLLFSFNQSGFKTNVKYAAIIAGSEKSDYLTEKALRKVSLISDFSEGYKKIAANCAKYSGIEADGVSSLYHKFSPLSDNDIIVLDIEISFSSEGKNKDRVDILLYHKSLKKLQFVEAKDYSNPEIWSQSTPPVIGQLERYKSQIRDRKNEIISAYAEHIKVVNRLFEIDLSTPNSLDEEVTLLIFGFDDNQKEGRLKERVVSNVEYSGNKVHCIGNIKTASISSLWNAKKLKL